MKKFLVGLVILIVFVALDVPGVLSGGAPPLPPPAGAAITVTLADEDGSATLDPDPFYLSRIKFQVKLDLGGEVISANDFSAEIILPKNYMDVVEVNNDNTLIDGWDVFQYNVVSGSSVTGFRTIKVSASDQGSAVTADGILLWVVVDLRTMPIGATPTLYLEIKLDGTKYSDDMAVAFSFSYGDANFNGIVSPFDAVLAAQHNVGLINLGERGRAGTDVVDTDSDGEINSEDVLEILEEVAAPGHNFPVEGTGNPPPPPPLAKLAKAIPPRANSAVVDISAAEQREDKWITTLFVRNLPDNTVGGHIEIEILSPISVSSVNRGEVLDQSNKSFVVEAWPDASTLSLAFAQPWPYEANGGVLAEVEFTSPFMEKFPLRVKRVLFEDEEGVQIPTQAIARKFVRAVPLSSQLGQNYPNPFNQGSWIPFRLTQGGEVQLSIFNQLGQLVRLFPLGYFGPGYYSSRDEAVRWDGLDEYGQPVATGVYFYNIIAGNFRCTRRMVLLK